MGSEIYHAQAPLERQGQIYTALNFVNAANIPFEAGEKACGSTKVDYSHARYQEFQKIRDYKDTELQKASPRSLREPGQA